MSVERLLCPDAPFTAPQIARAGTLIPLASTVHVFGILAGALTAMPGRMRAAWTELDRALRAENAFARLSHESGGSRDEATRQVGRDFYGVHPFT